MFSISKKQISLVLFITSIFSINSLPINPAYGLGLISILISFLFKKRYLSKAELALFLYIIIIALIFNFGINLIQKNLTKEVVFLSTYVYFYSLLLPLFFLGTFKDLNLQERVFVYQKGYSFLIGFMLLDFAIRLYNVNDYSDFYDYKFGPFYFDSNFSGLMILVSLFFNDFLKEKYKKIISIKMEVSLFLLLLSTFSRSAIFAYILYKIIFSINNKILKFILPIMILAGTMLLGYLIFLYMSGFNFHFIDGSFNSKFYFLQLALQNYKELPYLNQLFGIGLNNFQYISGGYFAHNILITFIYEFGILGSAVSFVFIIYCYKKIGFSFNYLLLPYITAGFSLFSAYNIFFFTLLVCMFVECKKGSYE